MAEKDLESEKLELSLFGRKRRKGSTKSADEVEAPAAAPEPVEPSPMSTQPVTTQPATSGGGATAVGGDTAALPADGGAAATTTAAGRRRAPGSRKAGRTKTSRQRAPKSSRRSARVPSMAAPAASLLVGAVVGLAAVVLTYASLQACRLVTGAGSCGGPGLLVLLAVVALMILGGSAALSMLGVPESGGLSFLGVALFVALCLVVLLPSLLEPWMIVVAPVLCALTYLLAHWIVTRFDEDILETDGPPPHDVR